MITYVDTSTLIKLVVDEPGSDAANLIWETADTLATVRLTLVEARATLASAARSRRLTPARHRDAVVELDALWASLAVIEVTRTVVESACDLAEVHALRGYDAVHLAAAMSTRADVLTSADSRLCVAAAAVGMHIANPRDGTGATTSP